MNTIDERVITLFQRENKPGPAQVGAISKAYKQQKDFKVSKYSLLQYLKNPKNWTELARRKSARGPRRAKRGPFAFFKIH